MKKILFLALLAAIAVGVYVSYEWLSGQELKIRINESQIQSRIEQKFPVEKNYLVVKTVLRNPKVSLREGEDRVRFAVEVGVKVPTQAEYQGSGEISGQVRYDADQGQFYLADAEFEKLEVPEVPEQYRDEVRKVGSTVAKEVLNRYPLYELDSEDRKIAVAGAVLRSVEAQNGRLVVTMGLP